MYPTGALASRSLQQMVRTDGACGCGCRLRLAPPPPSRAVLDDSPRPNAEFPAPHAATAPAEPRGGDPHHLLYPRAHPPPPRRQIRRGGASGSPGDLGTTTRRLGGADQPGGGRIESGRARAGSPEGGGCPRRRRRRIRFDLDHAAFACSLFFFFFAWLLFFFSPLVEMERRKRGKWSKWGHLWFAP